MQEQVARFDNKKLHIFIWLLKRSSVKKERSKENINKRETKAAKKKEREKERKICTNTEYEITSNKPKAWPWIKFSGRC